MSTERLYWEDPRRKTALATIAGRAGAGFLLDRTVFHAWDARYHHAQPGDRGHVLVEGHKVKVEKVGWDRGRLVHRTSGPVPAPGAKAQLHLDWDRRVLNARAHTLMHLLITALAEQRAELTAMPEVVGGGEVRFAAKFREDPAKAWPKTMARAQQLAAARLPIEALWMTRDDLAKRVTPQGIALDAIAPGEPTLRVVKIGESCLLPCDAPLLEQSWQVGELSAAPPQPAKEGVRCRAKVR